MTADNAYYSLYVTAGAQFLANKVTGSSSMQLNLYAYDDTAYLTSLLTYTLDEDEVYEIIPEDNGRYWLVLVYDSITTEIEFPYFPYFKSQVIEQMQEILCDCNYTGSFDGCEDCEQSEDLDSFSFLTYIYSHLYLFTEEEKMTYFWNYMNAAMKTYEPTLQQIFESIFWKRTIEGRYSYDIRSIKIYYALMYIYFYEQDYIEDTDTDYVDETYDITDMKKCIEKLGIIFKNVVQVFTDYASRGKIYTGTLAGIDDPCADITMLTGNPDLTKTVMEAGVSVAIDTVSKYVIIIIPRTWGALTEIQDNGGINLIDDFTRTTCGSYYLYQINDILPPDGYYFKIVI